MKIIHSRDNPTFKALRRLVESGRERRQRGLTVLDGEHLIEAWQKAHGAVDTLIVGETVAGLAAIPGHWQARETLRLSDGLVRALGLVDTPTGILAIVAIPLAVQPVPHQRSVLLDGVQDPGNVGSILRSAAAAGFSQVLLSSGCASAWSPRVLRAGQGAHVCLSIVENADLEAFVTDFAGDVLVTSLHDATPLFDTPWCEPVAWIFGSEGSGVCADLQAVATHRLMIPMPGAVESLNVGAAAAICLFESVRRGS